MEMPLKKMLYNSLWNKISIFFDHACGHVKFVKLHCFFWICLFFGIASPLACNNANKNNPCKCKLWICLLCFLLLSKCNNLYFKYI